MIATVSSSMSSTCSALFALGSHFGTKEAFEKISPFRRWRLSTLGLIIRVPPPRLKFNIEVTKNDTCVRLLKWFIMLTVCRVDKLPLESWKCSVRECKKDMWGKWRDFWQTLLKAFQKAFAVVDTFGLSLLHLKVTNALHYTSKWSFSETSYRLFSHSPSLPMRL